MAKRANLFDVNVLLDLKDTKPRRDSMTAQNALRIVVQQMEINNYRPRTIKDYKVHFNNYIQSQGIIYVDEINTESIYTWLSSMDVSAVTKLNRLKCLKALLTRFKYNGWITTEFYRNIMIKVDKKINKGASPHDLAILISLIDSSKFVGYRDVVAILTMYKTGIRITTLSYLEERHIDFDNLMLNLDGSIMKSRKLLKLPIDRALADYLKQLIEMNKKVRERCGQENNYVFITTNGTCIKHDENSNAITKQLHKYGIKYGLKNINAHAIRRAFAKRLLENGASVVLLSKALGHANLEVTTQYIDFDVDETAESLRDFM